MSLAVEHLELGPFGTNCYVVCSDEGAGEAVVIDPSGTAAEIAPALERAGASCAAILVTHGHFDHILGVADLAEATGAAVYMPEGERVLLEEPGKLFQPPVPVRAWTPDVLLRGGETIDVAGISFAVLSVPGHSPAHVAYAVDAAVFSGDVLFAGSVGRTDLPGADWPTLVASIRSLLDACPADATVYPGHGPRTTLGEELARNPFLDEIRAERSASA